MAVKRVWLLNAPSGTINTSQQYQIGLGYSFKLVAPITIIDKNLDYYRRYLNDPLEQKPIGPTFQIFEDSPSELNEYYRRYLNDPLKQKALVPTFQLNDEEPAALSSYFRRYLNDPKKK